MPEKKQMIICAGMVTIDFLMMVDQYPDRNETIQAKMSETCIGGQIGRAAVAAARLGAPTILIGMIGTGIYADILTQLISREPLQNHLIVDNNSVSSQHSVVILSQDRYRAVIWRQQPRATMNLLAAIKDKLTENVTILLDCTDINMTLPVAIAGRKYGCATIIDTGSYREEVEKILPFIDYIIVPEKFMFSRHQGHDDPVHEGLKSIMERFRPAAVIVTQGDQGGTYITRITDNIYKFEAVSIEAKDTCGAGDVFHGVFTFAIHSGYDIHRSIKIAAWAAAMKCAGVGNSSIPDYIELQAFLNGEQR